MPTSSRVNKEWICEKFKRFAPVNPTVIDVGAGMGTYSDLLRTPGSHWTGIEAFERYVGDYGLAEKYDSLMVNDVRRLVLMDWHDVAIFGDVLEHMSEAEAYKTVSRFLTFSRNILISVPVGHVPQGAAFGNEFERHRHDWNHENFMKSFDSWIQDFRIEYDEALKINMAAYHVQP